MAITLPATAHADGTSVQGWGFTQQANQIWKLELVKTNTVWPQYKLKNAATDTYLGESPTGSLSDF